MLPTSFRPRRLALTLTTVALLSATALTVPAPTSASATETAAYSTAAQVAEDAKLLSMLDAIWQRELGRNPTARTQLGLPGDRSRWTPVSDAFAAESAALARKDLERLRREIDRDALSDQGRLNLRMFEYVTEEGLRADRLREDSYAFTRLDGPHNAMPAFLVGVHQVKTVGDAEDYIARLTGIPAVLKDAEAALRRRDATGAVMPAFNYPSIAESSRAIVAGAPFTEGADSVLWADIQAKVDALDVPAAEKSRLQAAARKALVEQVGPAYTGFAKAVEEIGSDATRNDGAWALPMGAEIYRNAIRNYTTLDMSPAEIHALGLKEVARIQGEMREIMRKVGFKGDLQDFFRHLKTDPAFFYPDTEEGRQAYMARAKEVIDTMEARLPDLFGVTPKAPMEVRAVEAYREASSPGAFYEPPSLDGTRPGIYYANMADMKGLPKWDLETLAYHEGIPGHHMQIAIAQELQGVPEFRRTWFNSAYGEGWALYAEALGKEMGFFTDPYSDAGRLAAELFRAARLVVDTGLHDMKWTREQAIDYMNANTPNAEIDNAREVERYLNWPGQALGYKIGMIEIQRLRDRAKAELGDRFDIRGFHDTILANGAVPLPILRDLVDGWIAKVKAKG